MIREQLETLGWSQMRLATLLGCDARTVRYWVAGRPMPAAVEDWLADCVAHQARQPDPAPPRRWAWEADAQPSYLNYAELSELLAELGWSQQVFARRIGADRNTVGRWFSGRRLMPSLLADWMRRVLGQRALHPLPPPPPQHEWKYARPKMELEA